MKKLALASVCFGLAAGCGGTPSTSLATAPTSSVSTATPSATPVPVATGTGTNLTFSGITTSGSPITSYVEPGFAVWFPSGDWQTSGTSTSAFVQFVGQPNATTAAEIRVALAQPAYLKSVSLYSSITTIPYVVTGFRNSVPVFTLSGTVANTFGAFRTVSSSDTAQIDTLSIVLTNPDAGANKNPIGVDNVIVSATPPAPPAHYSLSGSVTDATVGGPLPGARVTILDGPDAGLSTSTGANGAYRFDSLTSATFSVDATATYYRHSSTSFTLTANRTTNFSLTRDPAAYPAPAPPAGATLIQFDGVVNGSAISTYTESGFTITAAQSGWTGVGTYGHPIPFIQFYAEAGETLTKRVDITAGGEPFRFLSLEIYSSTNKVPYTITGSRNGVTLFSVVAELPNPMGNFRQVSNTSPTVPVDLVSISLTNIAVPRNPVGIDNIIVIK